MREANVDISRHHSKGLDDLPPLEWDYIVTMGCDDACPSLPAKHCFDWDLPDPKHLDDDGFRAVRDRIHGEIAALLSRT